MLFTSLNRRLFYPPERKFPCFLLISCLLILTVAWVAQYGFNKHPCELCMLQRYPYMLVIALSIAGLIIPRAKWRRRFMVLSAIALLLGSGVALYHTGVELGTFKGPDACTASVTADQSLDDLRRAIMDTPLVLCSQSSIQFLGISMAGWNAVASLFLLGATLAILRLLYRPRL